MNKKDTKLIEDLKNISEPEELTELLGIDFDTIEISGRSGRIGFTGADIAEIVGVEKYLLPPKFGAYCNYLGGGIRGAIIGSDFNNDISEDKAEVLREIANACKRVYENIENEESLNEEELPNGETNWEALGTNKSRQAGIKSAY